MKKAMCKSLLEMSGDICSCGGRHEIVCNVWPDGEKYYFLRCEKRGETFE